jgi:SEC-C motif-containing protein
MEKTMSLCPCGSSVDFDVCCAPLLEGAPAKTAEGLMRSRYTAYVRGKIEHLERTTAQKERKEFNRLEAERVAAQTEWLGLEVRRSKDGGESDETGQVEFVFTYKQDGETYVQCELASFVREEGRWVYVDSIVNPKSPPERVVQIGRNDPCSCGSGKKYKKCCGG